MRFLVIDTKTGPEADMYNIALKEEWAKHLCYCDMEGFSILADGTLLLNDECGKTAYCPEDYGCPEGWFFKEAVCMDMSCQDCWEDWLKQEVQH